MGATTAFSQSAGSVQTGIDANPEGNAARTLGPSEACRSVQPGETFDVDIWVKNVPEGPLLGIGGFSYNLHFDPALLRVVAVDNDLLIDADAPFQFIDADYLAGGASDPLPATTGNMRVDYGQIGGVASTGDGVMSRVSIEALAAGRSELITTDDLLGDTVPAVLTYDGSTYTITEHQNAVIQIGAACAPNDAPTPIIDGTPPPSNGDTPDGETPDPNATGTPAGTSVETPSASPTEAGPTSVAVGNTRLAVDAISEGNEADSPGVIHECAAADVGDVFTVDVVIENVADLLAFEASLTYDPSVLEVVERDVELFLSSEDGSQVVDTSAQVPDDSGLYTAGAVDTADPLSPESGDGILVRLTMEAVASGTTALSLMPTDLNNDDRADKGAFLRNVDGITIGDDDGDTFFDGPIADAEIRVGEACEDADARVTLADVEEDPDATPDDDDDGSSIIWILLGIAAVILVIGGGGYLLMRSRRTTGV